MFVVYVQFNAKYHGYNGYVDEWKPGYYPSITSIPSYAMQFPSINAARAFAQRLANEFSDSLVYWEVI